MGPGWRTRNSTPGATALRSPRPGTGALPRQAHTGGPPRIRNRSIRSLCACRGAASPGHSDRYCGVRSARARPFGWGRTLLGTGQPNAPNHHAHATACSPPVAQKDDHVLFLSPLVPIDALGEPRAWPTAEELDGVQRPFGNPPLAASGASLVEPVRGERGRAHEPVAGEDPRHVEIIDNDGSWSDSEFPSPAIAANPVPSSGREV
jgi:hypothetical protein